ncbi:MAG: sugar ABC transporter permease [Caldilineaceae bacterium]|nr:sugar ABC transporter permease [Caldilineaceae bacterium]
MTALSQSSQSPPTHAHSAWQRWRFRNRHALEAWVILTPVLLYYLIFNVAPVLLNLGLSFTRWNGISGSPVWIGVSNYLQYLRGFYPTIIFNTALFAISTLLIQTTVAFFIAVLLNQKLFGRGVHRALWYVPTLTSAAIMAQVAVIFISPFDGVLNAILVSLGQKPVIWTVQGNWMRAFIIGFTIWRGIGGPVVLFLAALQGIHRELYEAAMVDGANAWQLLRRITIPLLRPMILFVLVTGIIGGFQIFEAVLLISKGGPQNMTNVMLLQIYNDAFVNTNLGVASAGAMIMALLLLWFSITGMRLMQGGRVEADS